MPFFRFRPKRSRLGTAEAWLDRSSREGGRKTQSKEEGKSALLLWRVENHTGQPRQILTEEEQEKGLRRTVRRAKADIPVGFDTFLHIGHCHRQDTETSCLQNCRW